MNYLRIARGSVTESQNWVIKVYKRKWITRDRFMNYMDKFSRERKMINALMGSLKRNSS